MHSLILGFRLILYNASKYAGDWVNTGAGPGVYRVKWGNLVLWAWDMLGLSGGRSRSKRCA